jgi:hypothetical protein
MDLWKIFGNKERKGYEELCVSSKCRFKRRAKQVHHQATRSRLRAAVKEELGGV